MTEASGDRKIARSSHLQLLRDRDLDVPDEAHRTGRPHFHATYAEHEASIEIETLEVLGGGMPKRALRLMREWAELRRGELQRNWELARAAQSPGN